MPYRTSYRACDVQPVCLALDPRIGLLEERAVVPEGRLDLRALVAEETLQIGLIRLGHAARFLDECREADRLLTVDQVRELDHDLAVSHHRCADLSRARPSFGRRLLTGTCSQFTTSQCRQSHDSAAIARRE